MINTEEYAWSDVTIVMMGRTVTAVSAVKYKTTQEKKLLYGAGNKPVARVKGQKSYEASITGYQSFLEALLRTAGKGKDITDLPPFDVVVSYAPEGGTITTDVLKSCEFTESEKSISTGDVNMEIELPLQVADIQYNI